VHAAALGRLTECDADPYFGRVFGRHFAGRGAALARLGGDEPDRGRHRLGAVAALRQASGAARWLAALDFV